MDARLFCAGITHWRCIFIVQLAHCVHLVAQHVAESDVLVRDCPQWVHELGKL